MADITVVTDSLSSVADPILQSLGIHWVPYCIQRGAEVLLHLVTAPRASVYEWLPTVKRLPMCTSRPSRRSKSSRRWSGSGLPARNPLWPSYHQHSERTAALERPFCAALP